MTVGDAHVHDWVYSDYGHHWCKRKDSEYHDFPCDHPEEHTLQELVDMGMDPDRAGTKATP